MVKNPPAKQATWVEPLGYEDPLEKEMVTYYSILAWRNPLDRGAWWAIVHGVTQLGHTAGSHRVKHYLETKQQQGSKKPLAEGDGFLSRSRWGFLSGRQNSKDNPLKFLPLRSSIKR